MKTNPEFYKKEQIHFLSFER